MNVLIIGSGAREDALAWGISKSKSVGKIYIAPGNAGTLQRGLNIPLQLPDIDEPPQRWRVYFQKIKSLCKELGVKFVVVSPELPLAKGLVDYLEANNILAFGPSKKAARIEGSKIFAKKIMKKAGVETASFVTLSNVASALKYLESIKFPKVLKVDGLAQGKGVFIVENKFKASAALKKIFEDREFGASGKKIIIEDFLEGKEVSAFALSDGSSMKPLTLVCDYKTLKQGGPNTGGVGSYAPPVWLKPKDKKRIWEMMGETLSEMKKEGSPFKGCLYGGFMVTKNGPLILEFNCRFGDPETQVIIPQIEGDLFEILLATSSGRLGKVKIDRKKGAFVCVVLCSKGYPGKYEKGVKIKEIGGREGVQVFHAGTSVKNGDLITTGGRVLSLVGTGKNLRKAAESAYKHAKIIKFKGKTYRKDIAL